MVRDVWLKTALPNQERPATPDARARATAVPARAHAPTQRSRNPAMAANQRTADRDDPFTGRAHRDFRGSTPRRYATSQRTAPPAGRASSQRAPGQSRHPCNRQSSVHIGASSVYLHIFQVSDINRDINRSAQPRPSTHNGVAPIREVTVPLRLCGIVYWPEG